MIESAAAQRERWAEEKDGRIRDPGGLENLQARWQPRRLRSVSALDRISTDLAQLFGKPCAGTRIVFGEVEK